MPFLCFWNSLKFKKKKSEYSVYPGVNVFFFFCNSKLVCHNQKVLLPLIFVYFVLNFSLVFSSPVDLKYNFVVNGLIYMTIHEQDYALCKSMALLKFHSFFFFLSYFSCISVIQICCQWNGKTSEYNAFYVIAVQNFLQ